MFLCVYLGAEQRAPKRVKSKINNYPQESKRKMFVIKLHSSSPHSYIALLFPLHESSLSVQKSGILRSHLIIFYTLFNLFLDMGTHHVNFAGLEFTIQYQTRLMLICEIHHVCLVKNLQIFFLLGYEGQGLSLVLQLAGFASPPFS